MNLSRCFPILVLVLLVVGPGPAMADHHWAKPKIAIKNNTGQTITRVNRIMACRAKDGKCNFKNARVLPMLQLATGKTVKKDSNGTEVLCEGIVAAGHAANLSMGTSASGKPQFKVNFKVTATSPAKPVLSKNLGKKKIAGKQKFSLEKNTGRKKIPGIEEVVCTEYKFSKNAAKHSCTYRLTISKSGDKYTCGK